MKDLLLLYYQKYRTYFVPLTILVVTIFVFFNIFMPQVSSIQEKLSQLGNKADDIERLKKNLNTIQSFPTENLDSNLSTVFTALPSSKDILSIYLGVINAADKADVTISGFSLKVGTLYSKKKTEVEKTTPALSASLNVNGGGASLTEFGKELQNTLPIAELKHMTLSQNTGTYEISFFYKSYQDTFNPTRSVVEVLSGAKLKTIKRVQGGQQ